MNCKKGDWGFLGGNWDGDGFLVFWGIRRWVFFKERLCFFLWRESFIFFLYL